MCVAQASYGEGVSRLGQRVHMSLPDRKSWVQGAPATAAGLLNAFFAPARGRSKAPTRGILSLGVD